MTAKVIQAWKTAALDLGLEIETPFYLETEDGKIKYALLLKQFGSPKGTLLMELDSDFNTNDGDIPDKYGYYCSFLNPLSYNRYDKEVFIETLNDWGFFGESKNEPVWYKAPFWKTE